MRKEIFDYLWEFECYCDGCGSEDWLFIHKVASSGTHRRLCSPCVLKTHPGSFCPVCFDFYGDNPPPPHQRLMCLHCPSISHLSCVALPPPPRYQCPPCSNPNYFSSSQLGSSSSSSSKSNKKLKSLDGESAGGALPLPLPLPPPPRATIMDKALAMQLMAAARIASASMNKAASIAGLEAERRVKEALLARNRAKEALVIHACLVSNQEKEKEKEKVTPKEKMDSKPMAEHQKIRPILGDSVVVAQKRIQNQIGTAVLGSSKNGLSVKKSKYYSLTNS